MLREMDVHDWKLTLYPNEEEDEITRLRRDEMEANLAQRMLMLGYKPELLQEGQRDIRFVYRKQAPEMEGAPPGMPPAGGAPPMMPPMAGMAGAPPIMGGMPARGMPPGIMQQVMPPSQPGGEGVGIRTPRGPARPEQRSSMGAGAPFSSVQQRGPTNTLGQNVSNALQNARRPRGA
jgi:hypothetical protein